MVTISDTTVQPLETSTPVTVNNQEMKSTDSSDSMVSSDYEKCREQRIKENLVRMQKLGIYDLSLKLKSIKPNSYRKNNKPFSNNQNKTPNRPISSPLPSSVPTRRSSRLQNTPAVSYTEVVVPKKGKESRDVLMMENSRHEVYTEEHEKMLGEAKTEWTLFVDGYGKDGKKIYDQIRGKTCHQCRQKTLGYRTHCINCNLVQGQFCGDCLYMRYGENVLEALQNPDWICPVCRGICNCSLCRQAKGWAPTGTLYRKISNLGYKSVAHYLIQTRRSDPNSKKNEKTEMAGSAKRSLSFSKEGEKPAEAQSLGHEDVMLESGQELKHKNREAEVKSEVGIATTEAIKDEKPLEFPSSDEHDTKLEIGQESKGENPEAEIVQGEDETKNEVINESEVRLEFTNPEFKGDNAVNEVKNSIVTPETGPVSRRKRRAIVEPALENSIAGRLRSRRKCT